MEIYRGAMPGMFYIFSHYVSLSSPLVVTTMLFGALSLGISIVMISSEPLRKYKAVPFILALVVILTGLAGSLLNIQGVDEAKLREAAAGMKPGVRQYYDAEYGYTKILFYLFPFVIGILSAAPSLLIGIVMAASSRRPRDAG